MDDTIYLEKEFKIGADFDVHSLKKNFHGRLIISKKRNKGNNFHDLQYMNLGFTIITPILLGVVFGSYIDSLLHSRPIATIGGLILGVVLSFYNLMRMLKKSNYA